MSEGLSFNSLLGFSSFESDLEVISNYIWHYISFNSLLGFSSFESAKPLYKLYNSYDGLYFQFPIGIF